MPSPVASNSRARRFRPGLFRLAMPPSRAASVWSGPSSRFPFTTLGEAAYEDCIKLGLIYFQTNISSIGNFAFKNCGKAWAFFSGDLPSGYAAVGQWWNYLYGSYSGTTSAPTKNSAGNSLTTAGDYVPVYTNKSTLNYNDAGFYYTKYLSTDPARDYDVVIILYNGSTSSR
jgi:hypothetical protein